MMSPLTIKIYLSKFPSDNSYTFVIGYEPKPVVDVIRSEAKANGYAGTGGIKEYWKTEYNATLRQDGSLNWSSITFKDQANFDRFANAVTTNFLMNG